MSVLIGLIKGFPGKPSHPPLTDASIGAYTVGVAILVLVALGVEEKQMAHHSAKRVRTISTLSRRHRQHLETHGFRGFGAALAHLMADDPSVADRAYERGCARELDPCLLSSAT